MYIHIQHAHTNKRTQKHTHINTQTHTQAHTHTLSLTHTHKNTACTHRYGMYMERERVNITEAEEIYKKAIAADPDLAAPVRVKRALKM